MATHSSVLAWRIPGMAEPGGLLSIGSRIVGHDWETTLSFFTFMHWRRKWQPTPVFLPGESQGRGSLVGCCLLGRTESDTTEATYQQWLLGLWDGINTSLREDNFIKWELAPTSKTCIPISYWQTPPPWLNINTLAVFDVKFTLSFPWQVLMTMEIVLNKVFFVIFNKCLVATSL